MRKWIRKLIALALAGAVACAGALPAPALAATGTDPVDNGDGTYTRYYTSADGFERNVTNSYIMPYLSTVLDSSDVVNTTLQSQFGLYGYGWTTSSLLASSYTYQRLSYAFAASISSGASCTVSFTPVVYDYQANTGLEVPGLELVVYAKLYDSEGTIISSFNSVYVSSSGVSLTFSDISADVSYIVVSLFYPCNGVVDWTYDCLGLGLARDVDGYVAVTTYTSASVGLLNGIIAMLQSIWVAVSSLPDYLVNILDVVSSLPGIIASWFQQAIDTILSVPQLIMDGLYRLFVPSAEDFDGIYEDFDEIMTDHLGLIWQVETYIVDVFTALFGISDEDGQIYFPGISVDLGETTFEIEEQYVDIFPEGFEFLQTSCKMLTTFCCICLWFKGILIMKDKYIIVYGW